MSLLQRSTIIVVLASTLFPFALPAVAHTRLASKVERQATNTPIVAPVPEVVETPHPALAPSLRNGRVVTGLAAQRVLHFTFDDGPSEYTPELLDTLDAAGVHATFFLVARQLERARGREIAQEIVRRGHAVGLHSYRHDDLRSLTAAEFTADLERSERVFTQVLGDRPSLFRPPYGAHNASVDTVLAQRGYTEVLWNIVAEGQGRDTADEITTGFARALDRQERMPRGAGGVVLLHDSHPWVVRAVPAILAEVERRNCAALRNNEELWDVQDQVDAWYQERGTAGASETANRMRTSPSALRTRQENLRRSASEHCPAS